MTGDLPALVRNITRLTLFFLSAGCLAWAIWPAGSDIFGGFMVGAIGGLAVSWHLAWKIARTAGAAASGAKPRAGFGFAVRGAIALLAFILSVRVCGFDPVATVSGLAVTPLAAFLWGWLALRLGARGRPTDERGEKR